MEFLQILGYVGALFIGVILGLIGGGGSILTVPIFVYLMFLNPIMATAYSLFVVGVSALVGAIRNIQKGMVDIKTAIVFSIPAFIAVYLTRKYLILAIPEEILVLGNFTLTKDMAIMIFFAFMMVLAAAVMIQNSRRDLISNKSLDLNYPIIFVGGLIVGLLTGIIGAGGGFMIIPVLVIVAKLPMKKAVATSLLIIAIKSLIGFIGDVENLDIDWVFLLSFTALSVAGIFIGIYLSNFIEGKKLKRIFGWFVLVMGIYILLKELNLF
jgi:uncharacterized membrane protein YfcA